MTRPAHEIAGMSAPVEVAVGVLIRPDGSFLIAQRPPGKPMEGYWEFPGGKLEPGETVLQALQREFVEELGLEITEAYPWAQQVFVYPHATVRLHFWRAYGWRGIASGREGQAFHWEHLHHPVAQPWLPGALPLKRWLSLPEHYAISNAAELGAEVFLERLDAALAAGNVQQLQLREKALEAFDPAAFGRLFEEVQARAREHGVRLLVNSYHPQHYWEQADGVHCESALLACLQARPDVNWCAASCHTSADLEKAGQLKLDFAVLGPVLPTASHPGTATSGWAGFAEMVRHTPLPVYALGGLSRADATAARQHGAHGIAMLRAAWVN